MIQSIDRALDILEYLLADPDSPKTLGNIAEATGLNAATASNIIKTMAARNYIEQQGRRQGYTPGVMCCNLSSKADFYYNKLIKTSEPHMRSVAENTGETVLLSVLKQGKRYILNQVSGGGALQINRDIIYDPKVTDTATGKVLLADFSEGDLDSFAAEKGFKAQDKRILMQSLAKIKKDGFSVHITHNSQIAGAACPVTRDGMTEAALGIFIPAFRFKGAHRQKAMRELASAAKQISNELDNQ